MRANPAHYALHAPRSLDEALHLLATADPPTPIAGGTELMVAFNAGRLPPRPLLSLQHLHELRFLHETPDAITIGAATTFTDLRRSDAIARRLPLLAQAASWTGSIANQNRATLGGNCVNASPAADSPPALLAYGATLTLVSAAGTRIVPYADFHLGYKRTALHLNELLYSLTIPCNWESYTSFARKIGTRNAQAISKVALACLAHVDPAGRVKDIRIAAASLADRPLRCTAAEQALLAQPLSLDTIAAARAAIATEVHPIDDIRSTAAYRATVAANLVEDFLQSLLQPANSPQLD